MHKFFSLTGLGILLFIFISYVSIYSAQFSQHTPCEHDSVQIVQYVDRWTFASDTESSQWLAVLRDFSQYLQEFCPLNRILIVVPSTYESVLVAQLEGDRSLNVEIVKIHDSDLPFNPLQYVLIDRNVTVIAPQVFCELSQASRSQQGFREALLGHSLPSGRIYIFSRFDGNRFRITPQFVLFLKANFDVDLANRLQQRWIAQHAEYRALLQQRNTLIAHPHTEAYKHSLTLRSQWLKDHPQTSIFDAGLDSQSVGEQFWQDRIWNNHCRYMIAPLYWPKFQSYTPYHPIITSEEIGLFFEHSFDAIIECALLYNDYCVASDLNKDSADYLLSESRRHFQELSSEDQEHFITLYGTLWAPKLFV